MHPIATPCGAVNDSRGGQFWGRSRGRATRRSRAPSRRGRRRASRGRRGLVLRAARGRCGGGVGAGRATFAGSAELGVGGHVTRKIAGGGRRGARGRDDWGRWRGECASREKVRIRLLLLYIYFGDPSVLKKLQYALPLLTLSHSSAVLLHSPQRRGPLGFLGFLSGPRPLGLSVADFPLFGSWPIAVPAVTTCG